MDVVYPRCAGLDVHKDTVVACALTPGTAKAPHRDVRTFGTMTADLLELGEWLEGQAVTHVTMESTGVYWQPIWNLLEERFNLLLVNAQHIKQVPGRKTDVKDAQWIAELLRHGLLKASFVPDRSRRELRELTRYRTSLIRERAAEVNRLQKTLEGANLKLGSVATDVLGVSGRHILQALVAGTTDPPGRACAPETTRAPASDCVARPARANPWLRVALIEAAHAASRARGTYLAAQYRRLAARRGKKKASVAVAHSILVIVYHLLTEATEYHDLGLQHFDRLDPDRLSRRLVRRLQDLGYTVRLERPAA